MPTPKRSPLLRKPIFLLPLLLSACGEMPKLEAPSFDVGNYIPVYRLDIRQGNFVSQEMVAQLKPGLTREQVRYALGTPLLTDPFHGNRWDYVYRYDSGHGDVQQRRLSVYFDDNKLVRVGGDVVAAAGAGEQKPIPAAPRAADPAPSVEPVPAPSVPPATP